MKASDLSPEQENLLRALELDGVLVKWEGPFDVAGCAGRGWVIQSPGVLRITPTGRRVLGVLDGQVRAGRVDRVAYDSMPTRIWLRLHPRQQDAWLMRWLFGGFEFHWDGAETCRGRDGDGHWHDVPRLIEDWKPLDLEDHLKQMGVLT